MRMKLDVDTLSVDSFSTAQVEMQDPALLVAQYPAIQKYDASFGMDCISCVPGCYYWVDTI